MRILLSRRRSYQFLASLLILGPIGTVLFVFVTDSLWLSVVPLGLIALLLVSVAKRLHTPLVLNFDQEQILVAKGKNSFTIRRDAISAIGVVGTERLLHLAVWIPSDRMQEFQSLQKLLLSRPSSNFGDVTAVPLMEGSEIGRKDILKLRVYLERTPTFADVAPVNRVSGMGMTTESGDLENLDKYD